MTVRIIALGVVSLFLLSCTGSDNSRSDVIILSEIPINTQSVILLQEINTGDLVCCTDTATTTAEDCAKALEKTDCYVRVQDIPYRAAKYDFLTKGTFPTRRWRENETSPRW